MDTHTSLDLKAFRTSASARFTAVSVFGADRLDFLQGQLTQDLARADSGHSPLAGWASAKGRLLAVGPVIAWQDGIHLVLPDSIAEAVANRLRMFILRARAEISIGRLGILGLTAPAGAQFAVGNTGLRDEFGATLDCTDYCIARHNADKSRAWLIASAQSADELQVPGIDDDEDNWSLADIRAGYPVVGPLTSEAFVPQMLNLDLLDAISFTKGCYVGQEIVARTQNLGRIKRRMYRFSASADALIEPGQLLHADSGATGKVVTAAASGAKTELLAVVPIVDAEKNWFADDSRQKKLALENLPYDIPA